MSRLLLCLVLVTSLLAVGVRVTAQESDDEAIKAVIRAETTAFYARQADGWEATWLHDAQAARTLVGSNSYSCIVGWEKIVCSVRGSLKASPQPVDAEFSNRDFVIVRTSIPSRNDSAADQLAARVTSPSPDRLALQ